MPTNCSWNKTQVTGPSAGRLEVCAAGPLLCQSCNSCALLQYVLPLLHAQVPSTAAKGIALMGQYAGKWVSQPVICATGSLQKAEPHVPTAAQPGRVSVKLKMGPAMLINQPSPCGTPPMPCWHTDVQRCHEQMIVHANSSVQQWYKARNNMLQSLLDQPPARSQVSLQLSRILVINPCNISAVFLYFVLVAQHE